MEEEQNPTSPFKISVLQNQEIVSFDVIQKRRAMDFEAQKFVKRLVGKLKKFRSLEKRTPCYYFAFVWAHNLPTPPLFRI